MEILAENQLDICTHTLLACIDKSATKIADGLHRTSGEAKNSNMILRERSAEMGVWEVEREEAKKQKTSIYKS